MEVRIATLEARADQVLERHGALEHDVAVIRSNYATKADVSEARNNIVMWVVSAILLAQVLPTLLKEFGI